MPTATARPFLILVAVILLWGANWPVMKIGVGVISPLWFALARMVLGALTLFAVLWATGGLRRPSRQDLPALLAVGLLQMGLFLACVNTALLFVEAGRSAVLAYTTPLWVVPGAVLLLGERLDRLKALGLSVGLGGIFLLFNPLAMNWADPQALLGNGLLMLAALGWAAAILQVRGHRWALSPLQLAPWQMTIAIPPLVLVAFLVEGPLKVAWSGEVAWILAYNGPLATAFCYWAAITVARELPAITASLGFLGVPVAGVLFSGLILGEPLHISLALGLLALIAGLALVHLSDYRAARRGPSAKRS